MSDETELRKALELCQAQLRTSEVWREQAEWRAEQAKAQLEQLEGKLEVLKLRNEALELEHSGTLAAHLERANARIRELEHELGGRVPAPRPRELERASDTIRILFQYFAPTEAEREAAIAHVRAELGES